MTFQTVAAFLSTVVAFYTIVPYIRAILKGKTKPHQLSWVVFVIMNFIVLISQYLEGARSSVLITLAFCIGSLWILILSFKYGTRDTSRWDRALFIFALATIVIWVLTKSNATAIWLTLLIDFAATTMLILKIRSLPGSEDHVSWVFGSLAYLLTNLSLFGTPPGILYVRPIYGLLSDAAVVAAIFYYKKKGAVVTTVTPAGV